LTFDLPFVISCINYGYKVYPFSAICDISWENYVICKDVTINDDDYFEYSDDSSYDCEESDPDDELKDMPSGYEIQNDD
jgi:hypothetical protein